MDLHVAKYFQHKNTLYTQFWGKFNLNVFPHLISAILDLCFHIAYIFTVTVHYGITLSVKDGI